MDIVITAGEAIDKGIWDEVCELKGWNTWIVNEGQMTSDEPITLTEEQARKFGVIK
jgi:Fe-S cluster biosynthesis and repair protein YggX